jgi:hypothetical protein
MDELFLVLKAANVVVSVACLVYYWVAFNRNLSNDLMTSLLACLCVSHPPASVIFLLYLVAKRRGL